MKAMATRARLWKHWGTVQKSQEAPRSPRARLSQPRVATRVRTVGTSILAVSRRLSPVAHGVPRARCWGKGCPAAPGPGPGWHRVSAHFSSSWAEASLCCAQAQGWVGLLSSSFEVKNPGMREAGSHFSPQMYFVIHLEEKNETNPVPLRDLLTSLYFPFEPHLRKPRTPGNKVKHRHGPSCSLRNLEELAPSLHVDLGILSRTVGHSLCGGASERGW